ncbi:MULTISPECIES: restriction endonuclease subunit S [Bacillus]|uniref:restriction endonuclease subunit S n=1 Tax=Bacillus TaxID=1386 RepID=UPI001CDD3F1B|nr:MULTISPECIES: restriction endonuclease subunit S [Bacillus]MCY7764452.1 restriction endonuclease subunit S [Bacillus inaquosorum]MCY9100907.1 restriction endonuclease subunit S [Bacillus inaquosorum]MCY9310873.1 restriction endonuclease subunit S [Bacillus inaquosorum]
MPTYKLKDLVQEVISGEWGQEVTGEMTGVKVIRTTNFSNSGKININKDIVFRDIDVDKVEKKKLIVGDTIIEKSGGSPEQPVGRVVYFEEDDLYLCNNFTSILRPNRELILPKYFMYLMFNLYRTRKVLKFQNKTTGIINLKLDQYLNQTKVTIPSMNIQMKIVKVLDHTFEVINKRQSQITALEELTQSVFLEMFQDNKDSSKVSIEQVVDSIEAGWSVSGEERAKEEKETAVLKISAVTKGYFNDNEYKVLNPNIEIKKAVYPHKGDILFSRANTRELVGASAIVPKDYNDLILPDKLWKINLRKEIITPEYFHTVINSKKIRNEFSKNATGTSGSMLNISMQKFKGVEINLPSIEKQQLFSKKFNKIQQMKQNLINSQEEINVLYRSLLQKAFKGELFQQ